MSIFNISNLAGQGLDMRFAFFGLSFEGEVYDDPANDSDRGELTVPVSNNPVLDTLVIGYKPLDGTLWGHDYTIAYKGGEVVFAATELGLQGTPEDLLNFNYSYEVIMSDPDDIQGNDFEDVIFAGDGDDKVLMFGGDDVVGGGAGNDYLSGGAGTDAAVYTGVSSSFTFVVNDDGTVQITDLVGNNGSDTLSSIERVTFEDGSFDLASLLPPLDPYTGNSGNNKITGNSGSNIIHGLGGNDTLKGLGGNDALYGGDGKDALYGGSGQDGFVFDTKPSKSKNVDAIKDFRVADDFILFDNSVYTKVGSDGALKKGAFWANNTGKAHDATDRVIYDKDSGALYYDPDGTGKAAAVQFATITKNLGLTYKEFGIL